MNCKIYPFQHEGVFWKIANTPPVQLLLTPQILESLCSYEIGYLCGVLGVAISGTRLCRLERLDHTLQVRLALAPYPTPKPSADDFNQQMHALGSKVEAAYTSRNMHDMARMVKQFHGYNKHMQAMSLLAWKVNCIRQGTLFDRALRRGHTRELFPLLEYTQPAKTER